MSRCLTRDPRPDNRAPHRDPAHAITPHSRPTLRRSLHRSRLPSSPSQSPTLSHAVPRAPRSWSAAASRHYPTKHCSISVQCIHHVQSCPYACACACACACSTCGALLACPHATLGPACMHRERRRRPRSRRLQRRRPRSRGRRPRSQSPRSASLSPRCLCLTSSQKRAHTYQKYKA